MMPDGRVLPKPPESQGDEPWPAGTALAPPAGVTRPASWYVGEILEFVVETRTFVKHKITKTGTRVEEARTAAEAAVPFVSLCVERRPADCRYWSTGTRCQLTC